MAGYLYRGADITTLDINPILGHQQPESARQAFICGDAQNLPFPDGCFVVVTLLDVLEHIKDDFQAVCEARRVTREAGYLLVSTPNADWHYSYYRAMQRVCPHEFDLMREWGHVRRGYSREDLERLFGNAPEASAPFINPVTAFFHDIAFSRLRGIRRRLLYAAAALPTVIAYSLHGPSTRGTETAFAMAPVREELSGPTIAIFPWGDVIEEFLDPIGLVVEDFVERMSGGWLFGYVAALQHAGWRPIVVLGSERKSTTIRLLHSDTGARVWIVPATRVTDARKPKAYTSASIRRWLATPVRRFREVLQREQCRALIIQEYEYTRFDGLVRLATRLGIPAFATFQGGDRTLSWIEGLVRRRSLRLCSGLIIASESERQRVGRVYVGCHPPIANIPNPIDTQEWLAIERQKARNLLGLKQEAFIAINHGRIDIARKGLDILLEAWAASDGDELVVIGSGQDYDAFAALVAGSGFGNVRWIRNYTTDRTLIRRWLSAADCISRLRGLKGCRWPRSKQWLVGYQS